MLPDRTETDKCIAVLGKVITVEVDITAEHGNDERSLGRLDIDFSNGLSIATQGGMTDFLLHVRYVGMNAPILVVLYIQVTISFVAETIEAFDLGSFHSFVGRSHLLIGHHFLESLVSNGLVNAEVAQLVIANRHDRIFHGDTLAFLEGLGNALENDRRRNSVLHHGAMHYDFGILELLVGTSLQVSGVAVLVRSTEPESLALTLTVGVTLDIGFGTANETVLD